MTFLSILGAIFLVILGFKFLPALIGIIVAIVAVAAVIVILAGIFTIFLPVILIILAIGGLIWLLKTLLI